MIPGRRTCPDTWTVEYEGLIMASQSAHRKGEFICVSLGMEASGSPSNHNGGLLYVTEVQCGSLPCSTGGYASGFELSCVVCSK